MEGMDWVEQMKEDELLDKSTGDHWQVPRQGKLEVILCYVAMPQAETMLANKTQIKSLVKWCCEEPTRRVDIIR